MPRLRPAPEPKKEEPKLLKDAIDNSSMGSLGEEVTIEEPEPEIEVVEPESEPEPKLEPKQDDATLALQKQLEAIKKSEEIQKQYNSQLERERDEARRRVSEIQRENQGLEETSILSILAASKAEAEKAQLDIENALSVGDTKAQAEAISRQNRAYARIERLEQGKEEIEARKKEPVQQQQNINMVDTWNLPSNTTYWLKANPEFYSTQERLDALKYWANRATKSGLTPHTQEHMDFVGQKMREEVGQVQPTQPAPEPQKQRTNIVSAPVSRDIPSGGDGKRDKGKVTLTREEQEYAKVAGVTLEEYAKQKQKYQEMRANGQYGDQR